MSDAGFYYDPTHPTYGMVDVSQVMGAFFGDSAIVMWLGVLIVGVALPLVATLVAKKKPAAGSQKVWAAVALGGAVVGAVCMRVVFYNLGLSVFPLF